MAAPGCVTKYPMELPVYTSTMLQKPTPLVSREKEIEYYTRYKHGVNYQLS